MFSKEEVADVQRKKFCEGIVPITKHSYVMNDSKKTAEYLDTEKFSEMIEGFFSRMSHTPPKKPLEKAQDLFAEPFIVGESHSHISPKRFLIENMKKMKENGCEILFMEHLFYDTNQKDLDKFFETGGISKELMARLKEMNRSGMKHGFGSASKITSPLWEQYDYIAVLHAAREVGIRVVGIDVSTVYQSQKIGMNDKQLDDTRIKYMNYTAAQIMQHEISALPLGKKWCGFMGNTHVNTYENTVGVAELSGARSVYIFDQPQWSESPKPHKSDIQLDSEFILPNRRQILRGDVIYEVDPRSSMSLHHNSVDYKDRLADIIHPQAKQTTIEIDLAVKYLARLDVLELGQQFGLNPAKELNDSYYFVEKITPVNPNKSLEQNNTFSFLIESAYNTNPSYTLYLSREEVQDFAAKQKELESQSSCNY